MGEMLHSKGYEELAYVTQDLQRQASKSDMTKRTTVVGHNDLHKDNLLSNETGLTLQGVVDFMLTGPSSVEREMRYFAYYENEVRQATFDGCRAAGLPVDEDIANYWMASQVVCSAIRKVEKGQSVRSGVVTALEKWYPDRNWSELREGEEVAL